ncbi:hypothetical protein Thiofri_04089 [Thiorhodovibrio frisius]|nr:hypothetical protein Thiofri_04089 [Thiorhodovibrio frisius]
MGCGTDVSGAERSVNGNRQLIDGIHLVKQYRHGVTIQFDMILIVTLLNLHLKQRNYGDSAAWQGRVL